MALSNWDLLAINFTATERPWNEALDGPPSPRYLQAQKQVEEQFQALQDQGLDHQQIADDEKWGQAISAELEAKTIRELELQPSEGCFSDADSDWQIQIYKNWLYVGSESRWERWSEARGFSSPTLMEIQEGEMRIGPLSVTAWRG